MCHEDKTHTAYYVLMLTIEIRRVKRWKHSIRGHCARTNPTTDTITDTPMLGINCRTEKDTLIQKKMESW